MRPDAPAIVVRGNVRTYAQMEGDARRWAQAITSACGRRPERVGLFAFRSETAYTGTLAALFAGATYVPLNPTFPDERTASMIRQADLDALLVDRACMPHLPKVLQPDARMPLIVPDFELSEIDTLGLPALGKTELLRTEPLDHLPPIGCDDLAYLLFTSGSTGTPKGVPVSHGNAVYFLNLMSQRYGIGPEDRFSQTFDQTFDLSVFDLFMAWANGASVYAMAPVDLLAPTKFINRNRLTVWFSVPSVPVQMCRRNTLAPNTMLTLRWSLFCGEPLLQRSAEAWQAAAPNSIVENLYGPTELTIACFFYRWDPVRSPELCRNGIVPIGRPYDGLAAMIVKDNLAPAAENETGELCVSGPQTTPGYWCAPDLTAQRFVTIQVSKHESRRFYRTGDLVSRLGCDEYVFIGRVDQQIKVLGHRVELGEIEAVLRSHAEVEHAVAFGWPDEGATAEGIVAFVSGNITDTEPLIARARESLPPYIVPQRIFCVNEMPVNANGKVDRRVLKERLTASAGAG
jgi:amino acid adenylation domain-containing protein